jgi:hypothetical protein
VTCGGAVNPYLSVASTLAMVPSMAFNAAIVSVSLNGMGKYGKSFFEMNCTSLQVSTAAGGNEREVAELHNNTSIFLASSDVEYAN